MDAVSTKPFTDLMGFLSAGSPPPFKKCSSSSGPWDQCRPPSESHLSVYSHSEHSQLLKRKAQPPPTTAGTAPKRKTKKQNTARTSLKEPGRLHNHRLPRGPWQLCAAALEVQQPAQPGERNRKRRDGAWSHKPTKTDQKLWLVLIIYIYIYFTTSKSYQCVLFPETCGLFIFHHIQKLPVCFISRNLWVVHISPHPKATRCIC